MSSPPQVNNPSPVGADIHWTTEPPTKPGTYWLKFEPPSRAIMVEVSLIDGELMVGWPNIDQPVAKLSAAQWRGPMPPSSGPGIR
jgi:hypothetical protein